MRTTANYVITKGEINVSPSKTQPDMTYTPQELLVRYSQGLPMDKLGNHFYSGDHDLPDFRKLDLTEQAEVLANAQEVVKQKREEFEKRNSERKKQRSEWLDNMKAYQKAMAEASKLKQADSQAFNNANAGKPA